MELFDDFIQRNGLDKKSYQYDGVQWCLLNELSLVAPCELRGGFLADEMGLGKTVTILGLMEANPLPLTLIVLPVILMDQWVSAIQKWMPKCRTLVYYGKMKKKIVSFEMYDVVVTTYMTVLGEFKDKKDLGVFQVSWNRIVFDEAHHLRNRSTSRWIACHSLPSQIRWLVSGTPVQNSKYDFYSLCAMLHLPASYYKDKDQLMDLTRHFILRRKKKDVLGDDEGVGRLVQTVQKIDWKTKEEKDLARTIHSVLPFCDETCRSSSFEKVSRELHDSKALVAFLRAKQMCSLPYLLVPFLKPMMDSCANVETDFEAYRNAVCASSKMDQIVSTLVERKDNGNGKIVFCQFSGEIDHLVLRLASSGFHDVAVLDGRTSVSMRKKILVSCYSVLILQIQTGSEGLNLQEHYSEVYFTGPHWNPFLQDQAIARCYRIGQMKPVFVFHFVMNDPDDSSTLDSYINDVQNIKRDVSNEFV
jgi:hypothetical protein